LIQSDNLSAGRTSLDDKRREIGDAERMCDRPDHLAAQRGPLPLARCALGRGHRHYRLRKEPRLSPPSFISAAGKLWGVAQVSMVQRTVFGEHCDAVSSSDCELDGSSTLLAARLIWLIASATEEFGTSATASTFS
jgi:hypothetical protein